MAQTAGFTGTASPLRRQATWLQTSALGRLLRIKLAVFGLTVVTLTVLAAVLGPVLAPYGPTEFAGDSAEQPFTTSRILGTDILGRDQLTRLRRRFVLLATGEGQWEAPAESWQMAGVLGAKGIPNQVVSWGQDYHHNWVTWREMLPKYLDEYA